MEDIIIKTPSEGIPIIYCKICNRVIPDDVGYCNISDCPHRDKLDELDTDRQEAKDME